MYRRPRRRPYIGWIIAILAVAALGAGIYGIVKWIGGTPTLDRNAVHLPNSDPSGVFAWENGMLFVDGRQLSCQELSGDKSWSTPLPETGMKAARVGDITVAWGGKSVVVVDGKGDQKPMPQLNGEVVMAAPGLKYYAVVTKEENQHRLSIYNVKDASFVDGDLFPYQSVLGMGFFGKNLNQIWTLVVDSHGTEPVTKLKTLYPGKATSGELVLNNEIGYAAYLEEKTKYLVGTHRLMEYTSDKTESKLIYGWNLQDMLTESNGTVSFLFAPATAGSAGQISALWYINTGGDEYRVPLPAGCTKAMLKQSGRLCAVTANGVWAMAKDGSGSRFYPIGRTVESIAAVIPGKAFVMVEQHRNYLIQMP